MGSGNSRSPASSKVEGKDPHPGLSSDLHVHSTTLVPPRKHPQHIHTQKRKKLNRDVVSSLTIAKEAFKRHNLSSDWGLFSVTKFPSIRNSILLASILNRNPATLSPGIYPLTLSYAVGKSLCLRVTESTQAQGREDVWAPGMPAGASEVPGWLWTVADLQLSLSLLQRFTQILKRSGFLYTLSERNAVNSVGFKRNYVYISLKVRKAYLF